MKVLVVVDMQHDFIDGALGTKEAQAIVPNVAKKVAEYAANPDAYILYTRDTHFNDYMSTLEGGYLPVPHCVFDTHGWLITGEVLPSNDKYKIVNKNTFGYKHIGNTIDAIMRDEFEILEPDAIEVCGLCTDICVISNVLLLKAHYTDIPILVDSSCCAGVTPEKHAAALEVMRSCQIDVL